MLNNLKAKNPTLKFYSVKDEAFKKYGKVIDMDASEIVAACKKLEYPAEGSQYIASVDALENLSCSQKIKDLTFGNRSIILVGIFVSKLSEAMSACFVMQGLGKCFFITTMGEIRYRWTTTIIAS